MSELRDSLDVLLYNFSLATNTISVTVGPVLVAQMHAEYKVSMYKYSIYACAFVCRYMYMYLYIEGTVKSPFCLIYISCAFSSSHTQRFSFLV